MRTVQPRRTAAKVLMTGSATAVDSQAAYPGPARHWEGGKVVRAKEKLKLLKGEVASEEEGQWG